MSDDNVQNHAQLSPDDSPWLDAFGKWVENAMYDESLNDPPPFHVSRLLRIRYRKFVVAVSRGRP